MLYTIQLLSVKNRYFTSNGSVVGYEDLSKFYCFKTLESAQDRAKDFTDKLKIPTRIVSLNHSEIPDVSSDGIPF